MPLKLDTLPLVLMASLVLGGCGGGDDTDVQAQAQARIDACKATAPAARQGVYGCVTTSDDVRTPGDNTPSMDILSGFTVRLYAPSPSQPMSSAVTPLASTASDQGGFYEIEAGVGTYWLCTGFFRCTSVTLQAGQSVRRDYDFGVGPGW